MCAKFQALVRFHPRFINFFEDPAQRVHTIVELGSMAFSKTVRY